MKFPHKNLLFFLSLMALVSCSKEEATVPVVATSDDLAIGLRCCTDEVSDMLENPRFLAFYDGFDDQIFDTTVATLDQFNNKELVAEFEALNTCIKSGNSVEQCIGQSAMLTLLFDLLSSYSLEDLAALQKDYPYLSKDEFAIAFTAAVREKDLQMGRGLPCYAQFRSDMLDAFAVVGPAAIGSGLGALAILVVGILRAQIRFCDCLYSNYGAQC